MLKEKNGYSNNPMPEFLKFRWNVSIHRKKETANMTQEVDNMNNPELEVKNLSKMVIY